MSTIRKSRTQLDSEVPPWVTSSKRLYRELQHEEVVSWLWEFSYIYSSSQLNDKGVQNPPDNHPAPQNMIPENFTPHPELWEAIAKEKMERPQTSAQLDQTPWGGIQLGFPPSSSSLNSGIGIRHSLAVRVIHGTSKLPPNFSRPLPRPTISDTDSQAAMPEGRRTQRNYKRRRIKELFNCMSKKEYLDCSDFDDNAPEPVPRDLSDHGYDPRTLLRPPGDRNRLRKTSQPPGRLPVETLRPPDEIPRKKLRPLDQLPKDTLRPPAEPVSEPTQPSGSLPFETALPSDPRSGDSLQTPSFPPPHASAGLISKLRSKIGPSRSTLNSWSSNVKNCIKSLPIKRKGGKANATYQPPSDPLPSPTPENHQQDSRQQEPPGCNGNTSLNSRITGKTPKGCKTPTASSKVSFTCSSYIKPNKLHLPATIAAIPLVAPQPFQCTFCLTQCTSKQDWLQHERSYHLQQLKWANDQGSSVADPDNCSTHALASCGGYAHLSPQSKNNASITESHPERREDWYWNCGFCNFLSRSWVERQQHLADDHYQKGETMLSWDPLKSPYPWKRGSAMPATGLECWDLPSLLGMQQSTLMDSINQIGEPGKHENSCHICRIPSRSLEFSMKHIKLWHYARDTWSCPTVTPTTNLTAFYDAIDSESGDTTDTCYCCAENLPRPQYLDRDTRMQHLRKVHQFHDRPCYETFSSKEQFCLHLANTHKVGMDFMKEFIESCMREGDPPARMTGRHRVA